MSKIQKLSNIDTSSMAQQLKAAAEAQKQQAVNSIDKSVAASVSKLKQAEADAQPGYDSALKQINIDEAKALDNQALYSEARGDKGGIGKAQYGSIQNTAASNRLAVATERAKLKSDTEQQIVQLQQDGEFEKADKLLSISNNYLTRLQSLEQWAAEENISVDQFNAKLEEWEQEYALDVEKMQQDYALQQQKLYASAGEAMLKYGIYPTGEQLEAMGWTTPQYMAYLYQNQ